MYKTVQTSRLYEQIVQQIEDSVQKGTLKEGDQLPAERELAQQFGVSRTAVREAIKALHEKGLELLSPTATPIPCASLWTVFSRAARRMGRLT